MTFSALLDLLSALVGSGLVLNADHRADEEKPGDGV